jgi:hypothetical protein
MEEGFELTRKRSASSVPYLGSERLREVQQARWAVDKTNL